jgi:uncharacterized integral membrane protein (TIGR00697 family)
MLNEIVFLSQLGISSFFILLFSRKGVTSFLYPLFFACLFAVNLFVNQEIILFGLHTTAVEVYSVAMFWIAATIYSFEGRSGANLLISMTLISNLFLILMMFTFRFYQPLENCIWTHCYDLLTSKMMQSVLISTGSFLLSYFIERKVFSSIYKIFFNGVIFSQFVASSIGQVIDTVIFTVIYFSDKPLIVVFQIGLFAYIVKLICLSLYALGSSLSIR